jgi:hypothetical protein
MTRTQTWRGRRRWAVASSTLLVGALLLYPKSWRGSRGSPLSGGKWIYRCPKGHTLKLQSKPRYAPTCEIDRQPMRLIRELD